MIEKALGKIARIEFGFGGYDDAMIGLTVHLETAKGSSTDFVGLFASRLDGVETEQTKDAATLLAKKVKNLLAEAKKKDVAELKGAPVEVTWENMRLKGWRILTEVL